MHAYTRSSIDNINGYNSIYRDTRNNVNTLCECNMNNVDCTNDVR